MLTIDHHRRGFAGRRYRRRAGFTLLELTVTLVIGAVLLGLASLTFSTVSSRSSARRAAQVFARDLALARSMAVRGRERVVIRFYEEALWYEVQTASGRDLATRRFGTGAEMTLSGIDLSATGDSLTFSDRGIATMSSALGTASFSTGQATYQVTFNSMGASQVGEL